MKEEKSIILERSVQYSLKAIKLYRELKKDSVGQIIGKQLLRSSTSIGANVHEAQGAQSKKDFIAKMSISHKEARESAYWLRIIKDSKILPYNKIKQIIDETNQIIKILSSILITSKKSNS